MTLTLWLVAPGWQPVRLRRDVPPDLAADLLAKAKRDMRWERPGATVELGDDGSRRKSTGKGTRNVTGFGATQTNFLDSNNVDGRVSSHDPAHNRIVQILISSQTQHR